MIRTVACWICRTVSGWLQRATTATDAGAPRTFVAIVATSIAITSATIRLIGLVQEAAVNLPFEDQWDLLRPLFDNSGPLACFEWQHGPHRQGLGGLINWYLYRATWWDVRSEAWIGIAILFAATVAMVTLSVRLRQRLGWSDAVFPLLILGPVHWETMLLTPNIAHSILPLLLVLLLAHSWLARGSRSWVLAVGVCTGLCLFTGFGICGAAMSVGLATLMLIRRSREQDAPSRLAISGMLAMMAIALIGFSIGYRWEPAVPGWRFPVDHWWDYGRFVALMFTSVLGWREMSSIPTVLGLTLLVLVLAMFVRATIAIWRREGDARPRIVWLLLGTSLFYSALTAVGRLPVSIEAAFMWRYTTLMMPALCGLVLAADERARSHRTAILPGLRLATLVLPCVIWLNFEPERQALSTAAAKHRWIAAYLKTRDLAAANRDSDFFVYFPAPDSAIIKQRLDYLEAHGLSFFHKERQ